MSPPPTARSGRHFLVVLGLMAAAILFGEVQSVMMGLDNRAQQIAAQSEELSDAGLELLKGVMPGAESFAEKEGELPVFKAYRAGPESSEQTLMGYAFLTADMPPEEVGYSGPIEVLVGIDLEGNITGIKVLFYKESIRRIWGDFLSRDGYQEQFAGKHVSDLFEIGSDVDGISRATITVRAMSREIRNSARQVAQAYL
jgi:NosR/NirI family transcriptional regulator, nitrous oxide reductase regulator